MLWGLHFSHPHLHLHSSSPTVQSTSTTNRLQRLTSTRIIAEQTGHSLSCFNGLNFFHMSWQAGLFHLWSMGRMSLPQKDFYPRCFSHLDTFSLHCPHLHLIHSPLSKPMFSVLSATLGCTTNLWRSLKRDSHPAGFSPNWRPPQVQSVPQSVSVIVSHTTWHLISHHLNDRTINNPTCPHATKLDLPNIVKYSIVVMFRTIWKAISKCG